MDNSPLPTLDEKRQAAANLIRAELKREGLHLDASEHIIKQAATTLTELEYLQQQVDKQGIVYVTASRNGSKMRRTNPAYSELKDLRKAWLKIMTELGLTPISRKRLGIVAYSDEFD